MNAENFTFGIDEARPGGDMNGVALFVDGVLFTATSDSLEEAIDDCLRQAGLQGEKPCHDC